MRKARYPMPAEAIQGYCGLPTAAWAMLSRLCYYFWEHDCEPLPYQQERLRDITGVHQATYRKHRDVVFRAFNERIKPELVAYYELRERKGTTIQFAAARSVAKRTNLKQQLATERQRAAGVVIPTNKRKAANQAALVEERKGETGFID